MVNIIVGNFRICNITTIATDGVTLMPETYGLGIERRNKKNDSWYVVCFVKYDENKQDYSIDSCGHRLLDIEEEDWSRVRSMIESAGKIVCLASEVEAE